MPLWSRQWPFLAYSVEAAPLDAGVYALWRDGQLIYIGCSQGSANSIRSCLLEHFAQSADQSDSAPDHYSWEVADDPQKRKSEMLARYQHLHGRPPLMNGR